MNLKVIRNEAEYEAALEMVEELMMSAEPGSLEADQLEVLSILVERYEEEHFPVPLPDPIEAIKFRMEQGGLIQKDLVPYIGSPSKVSDVLNRRRKLSLKMIRALHKGLGIPYKVLVQDPDAEYEEQKYFVNSFPFNEMVHAGYFPGYVDVRKAKLYGEELLKELLSVFDVKTQPAYCKHGIQEINENGLYAWQARAATIALKEKLPEFADDQLDDKFFRELLRFSQYKKGVLLVKEYLNKYGIHFILLPSLSKTYLDGASFNAPNGSPVIGMTLRYDRLDNFWFTLFHELGHVVLHLAKGVDRAFFDETDGQDHGDPEEKAANEFARNTLVSLQYWQKNCVPHLTYMSNDDVITHAAELEISPAILAGRVRWETDNYEKFSDLIGRNMVREQFADAGEL